jgi:hypothetical protein
MVSKEMVDKKGPEERCFRAVAMPAAVGVPAAVAVVVPGMS